MAALGSHQGREPPTIAAPANMTGTEGPLAFHLSAATNSGLAAAQLKDFGAVLDVRVGSQQVRTANQILVNILQDKNQ